MKNQPCCITTSLTAIMLGIGLLSLGIGSASALDGVECVERSLDIYQPLADGVDSRCRRAIPVTGTLLKRSYILCTPSKIKADPEPVSLVLAFHGGGDNANAAAFQSRTQWEVSALKNEFIVAYPNGCGTNTLLPGQATKFLCDSTGNNKSWNAQGDIPRGVQELCKIDDHAFVEQIIADIQGQYPIKPDKIFAFGHSKGGTFAYSLACDLSTQFAAIGVTAATLTDVSCQPNHAVSIFHVHNLRDPIIPFEGGGSEFEWPPVTPGLEFWAAVNGCALSINNHDFSDNVCAEAVCSTGLQVELCLVDETGDTTIDTASAHRYQTYDEAFSLRNYNKKKDIYKNIRDAFAERYLE